MRHDPAVLEKLQTFLATADPGQVVAYAREIMGDGNSNPTMAIILRELCNRIEGLAVGAFALDTLNTADPAELARYRENIADVCDAALADAADRAAEAYDVFPHASLTLREAARRIRALDGVRA